MTSERYNQLMGNPNLELTTEEKNEGWGFCYEYDFLLLNIFESAECKDCSLCSKERLDLSKK